MRTLGLSIAALGLLVAAPAHADGIDGEISLELGTLRNSDQAFDLFSENNAMPSRGVRLGLGLSDELTIVAGWHRVSRGATLYLGEGSEIRSAFFADEFTLGPKLGKLLGDVAFPYVTTQAMAFRGVMKLDDDPSTRHNPGQLQESAITPGVLGLGGIEFRSPTETSDLAVAFFLEMGYGWVARGAYGDFGTMKPGGFALRSGVGLRF